MCLGYQDIFPPASSFSCQWENGAAKYIQVTIPGMEWAEAIADRSSGSIELTHDNNEIETPFVVLAITGIRIDEGSINQSITLQARA